MGLISAAGDAIRGTLADQWTEFVTAPIFDEQTLVAPGVFQSRNNGRGSNRYASTNIVSDGSRIVVPEATAAVITDGGRVASASVEPGYFVFHNDGQPSIFTGSGPYRSLVEQSWERFKFGGQPGQQQLIYYINLREIRNQTFGTPSPLPYRDFSLVPPGSTQAPVLRLRARGQYSVRVADPIRFFRTFLPANTQRYTLADGAARAQLLHEFLTSFQAALQSLSRSTDIASLATHGPELAAALTNEGGPEGSWLNRFGLEVVGAAITAIDYDETSRELMDKYNKGVLLGGGVGNAYTQTTIADSAMAAASNAGGATGMIGVAMGLGAMGGAVSGLAQPGPQSSSAMPTPTSAVEVLRQLKTMLDQGLISSEQYAQKQREVLDRM